MSFNDAREEIDELTRGEHSAVSARLLSRKMNIDVHVARQWLQEYCETSGNNFESSWIIIGTQPEPQELRADVKTWSSVVFDAPNTTHAVELVSKSKLEEAKKRFSTIKSISIYAISKRSSVDNTILDDMRAQTARLEGLYTAPKAIESNWTSEQDELVYSLASSQGKTPGTKPSQSSTSQRNDTTTKTAASSASATSSTTSSTANTKPNKPVSFFGNQTKKGNGKPVKSTPKPQPKREETPERDEVVIESDKEESDVEIVDAESFEDMERLRNIFDEEIEVANAQLDADEMDVDVEEPKPEAAQHSQPPAQSEPIPEQSEPEQPEQSEPEQPERSESPKPTNEEYIDENGLFSFDSRKNKRPRPNTQTKSQSKTPSVKQESKSQPLNIPKYDPKKRESKMKQGDIFSMFGKK